MSPMASSAPIHPQPQPLGNAAALAAEGPRGKGDRQRGREDRHPARRQAIRMRGARLS